MCWLPEQADGKNLCPRGPPPPPPVLSRVAPEAVRWAFYSCSAPPAKVKFPQQVFFPSWAPCMRQRHSWEPRWGRGGRGGEGWAGKRLGKTRGRLFKCPGVPATTLLPPSLRLVCLIIKHRSFINIWAPWRQPAIISDSVPTTIPPQLQRELITRPQILQITFP